MSVKVKICGITNVTDAVTAATTGADLIGLMFYERSPRHVSMSMAADIARTLPPAVLKVGVFVNPDAGLVWRAIQECNLTLLQFHGEESPDFCAQFGVRSMKAFRIQNSASLRALPDYATEAYLLDAYSPAAHGGTGAQFNWELAVSAKQHGKPIFLAGGLTPENVAAAVRQVRPFGVDVSSGVESAPGKKDPAKVRAFIQNAHRQKC